MVIGAVATFTIVGWIVVGVVERRADEHHRRSLYEQFEIFPGATEVDAERYEITSDSGGTGDFGLRVTFSLPDDATSAEVLQFYWSQVPTDWTSVSDQLCTALLDQMPAPPTAIDPLSAAVVEAPTDSAVMLTNSRLTVFAPNGSPLDEGRVDGITFELRRVGDEKYLVADEPDFACGPVEQDRFAIEFDLPLANEVDT